MLLLTLLTACPPVESDPAARTSFADPEGATLTVDGAGWTWTHPDGTKRAVRLSLVELDTPDFAACSYDPWWIYNERHDAGTLASAGVEADLSERCQAGLHFQAATGLEGDTVTFEGGRTAQIRVDERGPGLRLGILPGAGTGTVIWVGVTVEVEASEQFYGLGEYFDSILHRGRVRPMQIEVELGRESGYNEVHVPVPLLVSSASWGMLADSHHPGVFDVAATQPDEVTALFFVDDTGLNVDLYAPPSAAEVTGRYWQRTGMPEVPPDWAFAPLHWRNENRSGEEVLEDARTLRELGLPTGVLWVDNPWQTSYNSMVPDPEQFPNWDALIEEIHALGFRMLAWTTPYVADDDPEHGTYEANGWLIQGPLLFSTFGDIVDLTHPDAAAAWAMRALTATERGIDGWKLDYGEDVQLGVFGARISPGWAFHDGSDERSMHHQFNRFYHLPYTVPAAGDGVLIGRGGCLGCQTVTDIIWPGDLDNGFEVWDEERDGELLVGGLASAVHGGTSLSVSGYPFYASDTGGYRGGRPTHESFVRWTEYAATLPVWQYGGAGENHNPWDFTAYGESQFNEDTLAAFARYARLHTRLWPYYQAQTARMMERGVPIVLPQGLGDPAAGVHDGHNFFVGPDLFVAPVLQEGVSSWTGTLPSGAWVHWWTGERFTGGAAVTVDAPLGEGPLFQRAGSVVPMLERDIVTLSPATDPSVRSWAERAGALNARVIPGADASATVADGASITLTGIGIELRAGTAYAGWDIEVYNPDGGTLRLDGVELSEGEDGCTSCLIRGDGPWLRAVVPAGDHELTLE